jgi:hypothetical protein
MGNPDCFHQSHPRTGDRQPRLLVDDGHLGDELRCESDLDVAFLDEERAPLTR